MMFAEQVKDLPAEIERELTELGWLRPHSGCTLSLGNVLLELEGGTPRTRHLAVKVLNWMLTVRITRTTEEG